MTDAIELVDISEYEMADYISRAFSAESVKQMLRKEDTIGLSEDLFQKFGNILQAYASATGDLSDKSINSLANDLSKHKDILRQPYDRKTKLDGEKIYFSKYVMPKIIENYAMRMKIEQPLSLSDACKILAAVETNCKNNCFRTHSFNGALLPEIKKNGLDIHKEMFVEEFNILSSADMRQPYQKGNLLFCELSKASFGYALRAPERLFMSLHRPDSEQKKDQSTNEFLTQRLQDNLSENSNLSSNDKQKVFTAGKKIIDFYFGEHNKSAIAFIKLKHSPVSAASEKYKRMYSLSLSYSLSNSLSKFLDKNNDSTMKEDYKKAVEAFKADKNTQKLFDFVDKFNKKYPENDILKRETEQFMIDSMTTFALNNFSYNGNADGYIIDSGKMPRDQFALAEFDNPIDVYVQYHKKRRLFENKLSKLRNKVAKVADKITETAAIKPEDTKLVKPIKKIEKKIFDKLFGKVRK